MTIEEAIKHCEEVTMENLEKTKDRNASDPIAINCFECADEHRQLAEWLKDYKRLLEQEQNVGHWECNELFYNGESRGAIITCSKCGNEFKVSPKVFENLYSNERFCNHCGARMESEVSE